MIIGIVGCGQDKFTPETEEKARFIIKRLMKEEPDATFCSGHSPLGGVDIYVEEEGTKLGIKLDIKEPKTLSWNGDYGYKARNIDIAKSDVVYVIVAKEYPSTYKGQRFKICYHCKERRESHVKSGGCYTGWKAIELGNKAEWFIL